jgi:hypothetical protein
MLNEQTIKQAVKLALEERPPEHDFHDATHTDSDEKAFDRAMHRRTPFEEAEHRMAEAVKDHKP